MNLENCIKFAHQCVIVNAILTEFTSVTLYSYTYHVADYTTYDVLIILIKLYRIVFVYENSC